MKPYSKRPRVDVWRPPGRPRQHQQDQSTSNTDKALQAPQVAVWGEPVIAATELNAIRKELTRW